MTPLDALSQDSRAGRRAVARLVDEGAAHVDALVDCLGRSSSHLARSRAARILGKIGALPNESRTTRRVIVRGIRRLREEALEPLIEATRQETTPYRRLLVSLLGQIPNERAIDPLIALLDDEDWRIRARAANSLRGRADPRAQEALERARTDGAEPVRLAAI